MFKIWKFTTATKAYWAYGSKIKFKQSINNSSINSMYPREDIVNNVLISSSHNYQNCSGEKSSEKRRSNYKRCFSFENFNSENIGLKVGIVGTVHYILNNFDIVQKDYFCSFENFKNLTQYIIDRVNLTTSLNNETTNIFNVIPKSCSAVNFTKENSHEVNIKLFTSLDNIHIDFNDSPEIKKIDKVINSYTQINKIDKIINEDELIQNITKEFVDQLTNSKTTEFKKPEASSIEGADNLTDFTKILLSLQCELANNTAVELADMGNYEESIKVWKYILLKNPKFAKANYNLALCYQEGFGVTKNLKKACKFYEESIALGHITSYYNLAVILLNQSLISNDKDAEMKAYWLLNVAAENGLSNATDALIQLSLGKDEVLNIESQFPQNIKQSIKQNKFYNQHLQISHDVNDDLIFSKTALSPSQMSVYNLTINQHEFSDDNPIINDVLSDESQSSVSQISSDIQSTYSDDDLITTMIQNRNECHNNLSSFIKINEDSNEIIYDKSLLSIKNASNKKFLRTCKSDGNIKNLDTYDSGNESDNNVKNFYLLGDFGSYSTDMMLIKQ